MAHGITKHDRGVVQGTTWHRLKEYIQQGHPVTAEQAVNVLDFPIEKRQLYRIDQHGKHVATSAWEVMRTDHDMVLVPHVGADFTVMSNRTLFDFVNSTVLSAFPDITIESVGTLFAGATAFVNLNVGEFHVKGDHSKSVSRLMYYNPLGKGKYKVCAHNIRVVCNNTLRMATNEAITSGLLRMVSHTKNAEKNIKAAMGEILEIREAFRKEKEMMDALAAIQVDKAKMNTFFDAWMPKDEKGTQGKETRRTNLIGEITQQFESDQGIGGAGNGKNMYGLLNAITYKFDHEDPRKDQDIAAVAWDGIVGQRSDKKVEAIETMQKMFLAAQNYAHVDVG